MRWVAHEHEIRGTQTTREIKTENGEKNELEGVRVRKRERKRVEEIEWEKESERKESDRKKDSKNDGESVK